MVHLPAERKLGDDDVARLRRLEADGWSREDLAEAFGITVQHVGRLVRGDQLPVLAVAGPEPEPALADVSSAVAEFLEGAELDAGDEVLAATARALAVKMDACSSSTSATAAQAAPRLAAQLVEVLGQLRERAPREPDAIDLLRRRREARLAAVGRRDTAGVGARQLH